MVAVQVKEGLTDTYYLTSCVSAWIIGELKIPERKLK
jgi:hypothetical protein